MHAPQFSKSLFLSLLLAGIPLLSTRAQVIIFDSCNLHSWSGGNWGGYWAEAQAFQMGAQDQQLGTVTMMLKPIEFCPAPDVKLSIWDASSDIPGSFLAYLDGISADAQSYTASGSLTLSANHTYAVVAELTSSSDLDPYHYCCAFGAGDVATGTPKGMAWLDGWDMWQSVPDRTLLMVVTAAGEVPEPHLYATIVSLALAGFCGWRFHSSRSDGASRWLSSR